MWHSGSCIFPQTVDPPVFHTFGWQKDASFPIRNSIFSIHAWVSTNSRLLIPRLRYVVRNFRKKERQCMATSPILLRTERHASWYFSIRTRFEISSNKMRNVSLEPYYTLPADSLRSWKETWRQHGNLLPAKSGSMRWRAEWSAMAPNPSASWGAFLCSRGCVAHCWFSEDAEFMGHQAS